MVIDPSALPAPDSARASRLAACCVALSLLASAQWCCAEPIEAPLELLYNPLNTLVIGKVDEINPQGRIVFTRDEVLSARTRPPELIDVKVAPLVLDGVTPGQSYLFGYSNYVRDPRKPEALMGSPMGPVLIVSDGLEPALFRDTPTARKLLRLGRSEHGRESRASLDLLLSALAADDLPLQNLAAAQIVMEPELRERLKPADRPAMLALVGNPAAHPSARALLLDAAARQPQQFGADWPRAAALQILATAPVDLKFDKTLDLGRLIFIVFDVLELQPGEWPQQDVARWVSSSSPALAERALLRLRKQAPSAERAALQQALADAMLAAPTRQMLLDHLRRLERADAGKTQPATDAPRH